MIRTTRPQAMGNRAPTGTAAGIVGLGKSSIYRKVQEGTFPAPIKLGSARASGWISTEIFDWIDDQIRRSRNA